MYGILINIYPINDPNVDRHTHGAYGHVGSKSERVFGVVLDLLNPENFTSGPPVGSGRASEEAEEARRKREEAELQQVGTSRSVTLW